MHDLSTSQGRTVLFVSHNISAVKGLCNKGFLLEQGRLKMIGAIEDVCTRYLFGEMEDRDVLTYVFPESRKQDPFAFYKFEITNSSNSLTSKKIIWDHSNEYFVNLTGEVFEEDRYNVAMIVLRDESHKILYVHDCFQNDKNGLTRIPSGKFKVKFRLPLELLNSGDYIISAAALVHGKKWIEDPESNALSFSFQKDDPPNPVFTNSHPMEINGHVPGLLYINPQSEIISE